MPRLNGKFASRAKYADAIASGAFTEVDNGIAIATASLSPSHLQDLNYTTPAESVAEAINHIAEHYGSIKMETPVTTEAPKTRKPRTVDPITAATARVRAAKRELDRAVAYHAKPRAVPSVEAAQIAYDAAASALQDTLNV